MSDTRGASDATYTPGRSVEERDRLHRQGSFFRAITKAFLTYAGVREGASVLDVGTGVGEVALLAAEIVGPKGRVVGVDVDHEAITTARERATSHPSGSITEFICSDIREASALGFHDVAVGRMMLMYQRDPVETVRRTRAHVKDGGSVAFQETDFSAWPQSWVPSSPLAEEVCGLLVKAHEAAGVDLAMGRRLRSVFLNAGLSDPLLRLDAALVSADDVEAIELFVDTLSTFGPAAEALGVYDRRALELETLSDRIAAELDTAKSVGWAPPMVGAVSVVHERAGEHARRPAL